MRDPSQVEALLQRLKEGDPAAQQECFRLLYDELHGIAGRLMSRQSVDHTLQPTALVNEAWIKLAGKGSKSWVDEAHVVRVASLAMRQVLVDHARRKSSQKRRGERADVELDGLVASLDDRSGGLLELDEQLTRLQQRDPEAVRLVELRFFAGCRLNEAARIMGISDAQAWRIWNATKLILADWLAHG